MRSWGKHKENFNNDEDWEIADYSSGTALQRVTHVKELLEFHKRQTLRENKNWVCLSVRRTNNNPFQCPSLCQQVQPQYGTNPLYNQLNNQKNKKFMKKTKKGQWKEKIKKYNKKKGKRVHSPQYVPQLKEKYFNIRKLIKTLSSGILW
jgi:hypothetical protein